MSATIGIRVPKELKDELEKLDIGYAEEVRKLLEEIVRRTKTETIRALRRFRTSIGEVRGNVSAEMIGEEREKHREGVCSMIQRLDCEKGEFFCGT